MLSHPGFSIISNHSKYLSTLPLFSHEGPRFFFYDPSFSTPLVLHRTDTWSMVSYTILSKDIETQVKCIIFLLRLIHFFTRLRMGELIESMNDFWVKGHLVCSKVLKGQQCPWMLNDDLESNAFLKIYFKSYSMRDNNSDLSRRHAPTPQEVWEGAWLARMIMSPPR